MGRVGGNTLLALAATILFAATIASPHNDLGELAYFFVAFALLLFLLFRAWDARSSKGFAVAICYLLVTLALIRWSQPVRNAERWLLWSREYKSQVLAQRNTGEIGLAHMEFDGWGEFGQDTEVYLVNDPEDLLERDGTSLSARITGLPCQVWKVQRLSKQWYAVQFFTNTGWNGCDAMAATPDLHEHTRRVPSPTL